VGADVKMGSLDDGILFGVLLSGVANEAADLLGTIWVIECKDAVLVLILGAEMSVGVAGAGVENVRSTPGVLASVGGGEAGMSDFPGMIWVIECEQVVLTLNDVLTELPDVAVADIVLFV
jgi:hypothetical protein